MEESLNNSSFIIAIKNNSRINIHNYNLIINKDNLKSFASIGLLKHVKEKDEFSSIRNGNSTYKNSTPFFNKTNGSVIYFSNIFDKSERFFPFIHLHDISTNHILNIESRKPSVNVEKYQLSIVDSYKIQEIYSQTNYLTSSEISNSKIPFELPNALVLTLVSPIVSRATISEAFSLNSQSNRDVLIVIQNTLLLLEKHCNHQTTELIGFVDVLAANAALNYFLRELNLERSLLSGLDHIIRNGGVKQFKSPQENDSILAILDFLKDFESRLLEIYPSQKRRMPEIIKFHQFMSEIVRDNPVFYGTLAEKAIIHYKIPIDGQRKTLSSFFQIFNKTFQSHQYLELTWRNLSSGEQAFLSMYSRFYSLTDLQNHEYKLNDNVIILMDEPDTNLHPQWQKTLLNSLLDFLPEIYGRKYTDGKKVKQRNIQIIFTTNNPISASDLLASNTVFMKLDNDKNVQIQDSLTDQRQTFGANIYSLYADSFFIQDGLMGKFASEKINVIIKTLNSLRPLNAQEREIMRRTISQIGEPAIKNKLIQMYSDRFNMDIHERLDNIEKKLKKDDQDKPQ
jgi:hypothetical protein